VTGAATRIHELLRQRGETVAVAESLTGGLLAAALVEAPGASATFRGGLVVYATDLKASLGGVPAALLADRGPVDPDVARHLATGARDRCRADWGLATTGVAGPDSQGGKPPGTVWIGLAGPPGAEAYLLSLSGSRREITDMAVAGALRLLRQAIERGSLAPPPETSGSPGTLR
jgi:nicotinamide-nucleotide amidase